MGKEISPEPIITWELWTPVDEITIKWESTALPKPISFTPEEYGACPDQFRCFICLRIKGKKKHFAGEIRFQRICRECWKFEDDWSVRGLINFDLRHVKPVRGYPIPKYGSFYSTDRDGKKLDQWDLARQRQELIKH